MRLKVIVLGQDADTDELFLQDVHKVQQVLWLAATNVIHGIGRHGQAVVARLALGGALHHADDAFHDVIDIGEVAAAVAVVVDLYGLSAEQAVGEAKVGHVGPSGGAISVKSAYGLIGIGPFLRRYRNSGDIDTLFNGVLVEWL